MKFEAVYLGLGSNVGDRLQNCLSAIQMLKQVPGVSVVRLSSLFETEPWGVQDQPAFLNMAVQVECDLHPSELLAACLEIEIRMGRVRHLKWGARIIDIDVLLWGGRIIDEKGLTVPHPYFQERRFVLEPLFEIAEEVVPPGFDKNVGELLRVCPDSGRTAHYLSGEALWQRLKKAEK